jgi:RNA 2',3'-cyclic 3'-phosphodiesterase
VRTFVALDIPDAIREGIRGFVSKLRPACPTARWIGMDGAHITLKFIGEVPDQSVPAISAALSHVRGAAPIAVDFRGVKFTPNERHPRVLWIGIDAQQQLAELARAIESALEPIGIVREQREFSPHLTLARFKQGNSIASLIRAIAAAGPLEFGHVRAETFHLYRSILKPAGAEYTRLETFRFAESEF